MDKYKSFLKRYNKNRKNSGKSLAVPASLMKLDTLQLAPFHPTPKQNHKFRYKVSTAITGQTVTAANIFAAWVLAISSTVARSIIGNMRIKNVKIVGATSTFEELYIRDANQQGYVDAVDATGNQGITSAEWKPSPKSLSSEWFNFNTQSGSSAASLFTLSAPVNSIIEVDTQIVLGGAAGTISGASYTGVYTQGYMYSMGLDGAPGSIYYVALGMNGA